jgi:Sec-independent protein translocase protein TatA
MEILGIGPLELVFIILIALIVLGPSDMVKAGRTIGRLLRQLVTSPTWKAVNQTSQEIRRLPTRLIREAGLEESVKDLTELRKTIAPPGSNPDLDQWQKDISSWTTPPAPDASTSAEAGAQSVEEHDQTAGSEEPLS